MVQNSLGRYWLESHPEDNKLKENWEFYLENQNQDPDAIEELEEYLDPNMKIEEVKVFDPACGSGHILVYVFDVLYQIYQKAGYLKEQIPRVIIENNLYGLEIDDRAYQLSCLSVVMKGLEYNNRFLQDIQDNDLKINIVSIQETNELTEEDINYLVEGRNKEREKGTLKYLSPGEEKEYQLEIGLLTSDKTK
jgi:type II restriction/modification system DNA methylase subunit YeeA